MSKKKKKEKEIVISDIKTTCCNVGWYIRSRANYRCEKCDNDITLHIVLANMAIDKSEKK